jgi:uncharacterized membrane protein
MKKKYFVIDFKKIKTEAQFNNWILGHNERKHNRERPNVNKKKTIENIVLYGAKYKSYRDFIEQKREEIKKINRENQKKRREYVKELIAQGMDKKEAQKIARKKYPKRRAPSANQAVGFALVVDCSEMENWSDSDYIRYLQDAEAFFRERFKNLEILSSVIHLDEKKPHLHISFSYWDINEKRFIEKKLFDEKLTDLNAILRNFEAEVGQKYGLHRGDGATLKKSLIKELNEKKETIEVVKGSALLGLITLTEQKYFLSPGVVKKTIKEKWKFVKELGHAEKVRELDAELRKANETIQTLTKEKKRSERTIDALEKELSKTKQKLREVTKEKELAESENQKLKKQNEILIDELTKTKAKLTKNPEQAKRIIKEKIKENFKTL